MIRENQRYTEDMFPITQAPIDPGQEHEDEKALDAPENDPVQPVRKVRKGRKVVQEFLGGDYLSREWVTGNILFLLYLAFLAMVYIGNTYSTEKKYKDIERIKSELKELRYHYITTKAALMYEGRQSVISVRAVRFGLNETNHPPYKILYSSQKLNENRRDEGH